jgi:hypothetical protein
LAFVVNLHLFETAPFCGRVHQTSRGLTPRARETARIVLSEISESLSSRQETIEFGRLNFLHEFEQAPFAKASPPKSKPFPTLLKQGGRA